MKRWWVNSERVPHSIRRAQSLSGYHNLNLPETCLVFFHSTDRSVVISNGGKSVGVHGCAHVDSGSTARPTVHPVGLRFPARLPNECVLGSTLAVADLGELYSDQVLAGIPLGMQGDRFLLMQSGAHSLGMCSARYAALELDPTPSKP
eukprot:1817318-Amphidinium_carterae.1